MEKLLLEYRKVYTDDSEMRYDILLDEWVLVSKARGKRPDEFIAQEKSQQYNEDTDVFRDPEATEQEPDVLIYRDDEGEWTTRVFPNKFPATNRDEVLEDVSEGPYPALTATGAHEIVLTRDGHRTFALLEITELAEVLDAYQERYLALMTQRHVRSITIFHNHGKKAGASVVHPHSQILALPVITSLVGHELRVVDKYLKQTGENIFVMMLSYEMEVRTRIVYENAGFLVYCPFASSRAFGMRILPKKPQPYFERITGSEKLLLADALSAALRALYIGLDDPDFNYYIRTAPCNGHDYEQYSYYLEIFPRTHLYAGFEFATDIEIVPIAPEDAAAYLRESLSELAH